MAVPLSAGGVAALIDQFGGYGAFLTSLITNFLATFGDKGQLAVISLAAIYDPKRVFFGAVSAFAIWNVIEVFVGTAALGALPPGVKSIITGGLFVAVGLWTCYQAYSIYTETDDGERDADIASVFPPGVYKRVEASGAFAIAFVAIAVAEFGDKTQLLTINLGATFPNSPWLVIVGAWLGLALRTGLDAILGEVAERLLPMAFMQAAGAAIFVAVGLFQWGIFGGTLVVEIAIVAVAFAVAGALYRRRKASSRTT